MRVFAVAFLVFVTASGFVAACSGITGEAAPGDAGGAGIGAQAGSAIASGDANGLGGAGNASEGGRSGDIGGQLSSVMRRAENCADITAVLRERLTAFIGDSVLVGSGGSSAWVVGVADVGGSGGTGGATGAGGSTFGGNQGTGGSGQPVVCVRNGAPPWWQVNAAKAQPVVTDGERLYLAQSDQLRVIDARSPNSLAEVGSTALAHGDLGTLVLDGATPEEKTLVVLSTGFDEEVAVAAGRPYVDGCSPETFIKATVLRFAEGTATLDAEYFYQGHLMSAWSGASGVRELLGTVPPLPAGLRITPTSAEAKRAQELMLAQLAEQGIDPAGLSSDELKNAYRKAVTEVLADVNEAAISKVRAEDWLPKAFVRRAGALEPLPITCSDVYIPATGTLGDGVTFVASLQGPSGPGISALLGSSPTIYQRDSTLVLGSPVDYQLIDFAPTYLHAFDVGGDAPFTYRGSGYVDARVTSPWGMDGDADSLRVLGDQSTPEGPSGKLFVLGAENGELELLGESESFPEAAGPARFVGDAALVSVGQKLLTIDLSVPETPQIASTSELARITDDALIIDEQHVLTIEPSDGFDFHLQLLDISDKSAPQSAFSYDLQLGLNDRPLTSFDREFTYDRDSGTLALSFSGIQDLSDGAHGFGTLINWLSLYAISTRSGIEPLGRLDGAHLEGLLTEDTCQQLPYDAARFDWSFVSNGALFGVARQAVVAAPLNDLQQRSSLLLPECGL